MSADRLSPAEYTDLPANHRAASATYLRQREATDQAVLGFRNYPETQAMIVAAMVATVAACRDILSQESPVVYHRIPGGSNAS